MNAKTQRASIPQNKRTALPEQSLPHSPDAERALLGGEWQSASEADQRLLDFFGSLVLDVARTHPRVRDLDVALWIARLAVGENK